MTGWEKDYIKAFLLVEEQTEKKIKKAYETAASKVSDAVRMFALSKIMAKMQKEQPGGMPGYYQVYQKQYRNETEKALQDPMQELETSEREIIEESLWQNFLIGAVAVLYSLHKNRILLVLPVQRGTSPSHVINGKIVFTEPKIAEWHQYIKRDANDLRVRTIADIQRAIASGKGYEEIAGNIAKEMNGRGNLTNYRRAYNKTLMIARTESSRIRNEAQYQVMIAAKKQGANIQKQWCAALDAKTRESHAILDGEIRELEERFSNGLFYPCQAGAAPEEVINCRCVALTRATWNRDEAELQELYKNSESLGLNKVSSFDEFKQKYLKAFV